MAILYIFHAETSTGQNYECNRHDYICYRQELYTFRHALITLSAISRLFSEKLFQWDNNVKTIWCIHFPDGDIILFYLFIPKQIFDLGFFLLQWYIKQFQDGNTFYLEMDPHLLWQKLSHLNLFPLISLQLRSLCLPLP